MHELGIVCELVELATARAGGARVTRVVFEIGRLSGVLPDAVAFSFDLVAEGTPVQGAVLEIVEIPGRARCSLCRVETALSHPYGRCECGSTELQILAGQELKIRRLEVVSCA
jgi:hydrogenase nickel incorporation protein HypA/HybF